MTFKTSLQSKSWTKDEFLISTDPSLLPVSKLIHVFASSDFYWARTLSPKAMREMLDNSLSFGLYQQPKVDPSSDSPETTPELQFVGIARCVTDFITFSYLTDVWVDPAYQGKGLGSWLVRCVQEVLEEMPDLRRSMLFTADWQRSVPFYKKLMGMSLIETREGEGLAIMESKGKGHPSYGREGTGY
ncbi:hypothetical protein FOBRF1_012066 [Fusarium oxysporum]